MTAGGENAPLTGRRVRLRPVEARDYEWLYRLATAEGHGQRWRLRGATPSPEAFVTFLWQNTLYQAVIERLDTHEPVGLVQLINVDQRNSHGYVSFLLEPAVVKSGWPLEGLMLFVHYVFTAWPLRKLYLESLSTSLEDYRSAVGPFLTEEGCLRDHEFIAGRWVDFHILALYRDTWEAERERMLALVAPVAPVAPVGATDGAQVSDAVNAP